MIVDMQVHLWDVERPLPATSRGVPFRSEPYLAEDLLPLMDAAGVDRVIIVPPALADYDNSYALACAARWPDRFAVMGRIDPIAPGVLDLLETWLDQPGMVGMRLPFHTDAHKRWSSLDALDGFFAVAERQRIPTTLFASEALEKVAPVAARFPGLPIIVDHLGWPREGQGEHRQIDLLLGLAEYPNLSVKVSAIALKSAERYPFTDMWPVIRAAYEKFGADRLLWGSDWTQTMTFEKGTYQEDVDWLRVAADFIPEGDRRKILGENACRILRWPPGRPSTGLQPGAPED